MSRKVYFEKLKESIFKRPAPPNAEKVTDLSKETGITVNTLYTWRAKVIKNNPTNNKKSSKWSSRDKFQAVLETASLSELETAKYCREKGIHFVDFKSWIKLWQNANENKFEDSKKIKINLKKELREKKKALAETAALLVLRKKARAILGTQRTTNRIFRSQKSGSTN